MAELAEGARLLSECRGKLLPRVRIPLSPPGLLQNLRARVPLAKEEAQKRAGIKAQVMRGHVLKIRHMYQHISITRCRNIGLNGF